MKKVLLIGFVGIAFLFVLPLTTVLADDLMTYTVKQINLTVDGKLDEWAACPARVLDQLKDSSPVMPTVEDITGYAKIGWNPADPNRFYVAYEMIDDKLQTTNSAKKAWFNDGVDFTILNPLTQKAFQRMVISDGETLAATSTEANTEWAVVSNGNTTIYEFTVDVSALGFTIGDLAKSGKGLNVGVQYNDGENDVRETQIGWVKGGAWDVKTFVTLIFE